MSELHGKDQWEKVSQLPWPLVKMTTPASAIPSYGGVVESYTASRTIRQIHVKWAHKPEWTWETLDDFIDGVNGVTTASLNGVVDWGENLLLQEEPGKVLHGFPMRIIKQLGYNSMPGNCISNVTCHKSCIKKYQTIKWDLYLFIFFQDSMRLLRINKRNRRKQSLLWNTTWRQTMGPSVVIRPNPTRST